MFNTIASFSADLPKISKFDTFAMSYGVVLSIGLYKLTIFVLDLFDQFSNGLFYMHWQFRPEANEFNEFVR